MNPCYEPAREDAMTVASVQGDSTNPESYERVLRGQRAQALITDGSWVALVGGYQSDRTRVVLGRLSGEIFEPVRTCQWTLPDRQPLDQYRIIGRIRHPDLCDPSRWLGYSCAQ